MKVQGKELILLWKKNGKTKLINELTAQKNAKLFNDNNNLKRKIETVSEEREKFEALNNKLKKKTNSC